MKKSIFNVALLSMLFVLGACSTTGEGDKDTTIPGGTGDPVIDAGIKDALTQVGSVDGMDIWSSLTTNISPNSTRKTLSTMYFSADKYKQITPTICDGTNSGITYDNEIVFSVATEGDLTTATTFKLFDSTSNEISELKGYTTLYTTTPTKASTWQSTKLEGTGKWVSAPPEALGALYAIIKKTATELSTIDVGPKKDGSGSVIPNEYVLYHPDMATAIADSITFTKK